MLTKSATADSDCNVANAGVEEVDAADTDESRVAGASAAATAGAVVAAVAAAAAGAMAAPDGGRGDKLGRLRVAGRRLPRAPCTVEKAERRPPVSMMKHG